MEREYCYLVNCRRYYWIYCFINYDFDADIYMDKRNYRYYNDTNSIYDFAKKRKQLLYENSNGRK